MFRIDATAFARRRYSLGRYVRMQFFHPLCIVCGNASYALCVECLPAVSRMRVLPILGVHRPVLTLGAYRGKFTKAILAFKDGRRDVGDVLIRELAVRAESRLGHDAAEALQARDLALIGVPTTAARRRARGFDGGVFLAHGIAAAWNIPARPCLQQIAGDSQRGKSRAERFAGTNRFRVRRPPPERCALIIDDVVTTGATLQDITRVLRENGVHVLGALAAAYVP